MFAVENGAAVATLQFPAAAPVESAAVADAGSIPEDSASRARLNVNLSFDTFVTGKANQLARAAAMQVSDKVPGLQQPPVLYGALVLGRTHI